MSVDRPDGLLHDDDDHAGEIKLLLQPGAQRAEQPDMSFRPRPETANWAAATSVGCVVLAIGTRDSMFVFAGLMTAALLFQCTQRISIDGRYVTRVGLRPVVLDFGTAELVHEGSSWWRELFFCGPMLQFRDADGHRLYVESWLWPAELREQLRAWAASTGSS